MYLNRLPVPGADGTYYPPERTHTKNWGSGWAEGIIPARGLTVAGFFYFHKHLYLGVIDMLQTCGCGCWGGCGGGTTGTGTTGGTA